MPMFTEYSYDLYLGISMLSFKPAEIYVISYLPESRLGRVVTHSIASDANGPGSTPGCGTLEDDSSFHPFEVGKLSISFMLRG